MNYKIIIQELKASQDPNVLAFVKEVEHMKRLTTKKRGYYLRNHRDPEAVRILVNDYIPYIIRVAYEHKDLNRKMSVLDLINEGILGAYDAFKNEDICGHKMTANIRLYINRYINDVAENNGCSSDEDFYSHEYSLDNDEEEDIINEMDHERERILLRNLLDTAKGIKFRGIVRNFYFDCGQNYNTVADMYGLSRERIRQIVKTPLKRNGSDLWNLLSKDFNLPVNEAYLRRKFQKIK